MMKTLIVTPEVRLYCVAFRTISKYLSVASVSEPVKSIGRFEPDTDGDGETGALVLQ